MPAPRTPPRLAIIEAHSQRSRFRGALTGSVVAHFLLLFVAVYDFSCAGPLGEPSLAAGGDGPRGGGGGGGAEVIGYMQLPAYIPPQAEQPQPQQRDVPPEEAVLVIPEIQIADIQQSDIALRERQPINLAEVIGRGDGTGGGAGRGTGSGGGTGSGIGTGTGSDVGPGSGGAGGDIFPPSPRLAFLPPTPVPSRVRGRYRVRFLVAADGSVRRIEVSPEVRDGDYRRRFLEVLRGYEFTPATTRDGTPIEAIAELYIEL